MTTDQFIDRVTGKPATAYTPPEDRVPAPAAAPEPSSVLPDVQPGDRAEEAQESHRLALAILQRDVAISERDEAQDRRQRAIDQCRHLHQDDLPREEWHLRTCGAFRGLREVQAERDALAVKLARVEALRDEWVRGYRSPTASSWAKVHADALSAALADAASPSGLDDDAPTEAECGHVVPCKPQVAGTKQPAKPGLVSSEGVDLLAALQSSVDKAREARTEAGR